MFKIFFKAPQPLACDGDGDVNLEAKNMHWRLMVTVKKKAKDLTYVLQMVHTFSGGGDVEAKRQKI